MTTQVLTPSLYQQTITTSAVPWEAGKTQVQLDGLLSDADAGDPTRALNQFAIEISFDQGQIFSVGVSKQWKGDMGIDGKTPQPPSLTAGYSAGHTPTHVRGRLDIPQSLSIGAQISFS